MKMPGVAMPWLVGYYGVFQAGHVVLNVLYLSGLRPIQEFPWPPAEGWHPQATAFWTATGLIDTAIALLALYFVAAFFWGRRRVLWAGLISLAMYMGTIFTFNYTVVATGAWARHPVECRARTGGTACCCSARWRLPCCRCWVRRASGSGTTGG